MDAYPSELLRYQYETVQTFFEITEKTKKKGSDFCLKRDLRFNKIIA